MSISAFFHQQRQQQSSSMSDTQKPTTPTEEHDTAEADFIARRCERFAPEPPPQYAHGKTAREHAGTSA